MSRVVLFCILLGFAATALGLSWPKYREPIDTVLCGEIAAMSPDEFRIWLAPMDRRTLPQVLACILQEARV